jgi:hypothetical protein
VGLMSPSLKNLLLCNHGGGQDPRRVVALVKKNKKNKKNNNNYVIIHRNQISLHKQHYKMISFYIPIRISLNVPSISVYQTLLLNTLIHTNSPVNQTFSVPLPVTVKSLPVVRLACLIL